MSTYHGDFPPSALGFPTLIKSSVVFLDTTKLLILSPLPLRTMVKKNTVISTFDILLCIYYNASIICDVR